MEWSQIVLILLICVVVGVVAGLFMVYLIFRLIKDREAASAFEQWLKWIKPKSGLIPGNLLVWVLILVIIFFPSSPLRIILGIPILLFLPGYTLLAALFTTKEGMGGIQRVALSFGLSIAVVPLIGLIFNYTPWGIGLEPIMYSVASFILITSIIAWFRQSRLAEHERFAIHFQLTFPGWGKGTWDRVLAITLVIAILGALGTLGYVIVKPKVGETFTEFYILGEEGQGADYPRELDVGEEARVIVGIINHEGSEVSYRVEVMIDRKKNIEVGPVVLVDKQEWEGEVGFVPERSGKHQKVEFMLYKNGEIEVCLEPLYLWVDVVE